MSVIVPAGKNRRDWVPQESALVKTANTEEAVEPKDELLEAAMGVLKRQEEVVVEAAVEKVCKCAEECKCDGDCNCAEGCKCEETTEACTASHEEECDEVEIEVEVEEEKEPEEVLDEVKEDGVVTEEEEEVVEQAAVEKIKGAVETIEIALEEVTDAEEALTKVKEAVETVEEVHEEMGEGTEETEDTGEVSFTEEIVEDSVEDEPVVASSEEEFCKFAKISPKNRAKIANYWKNSLGYPADYVDLLTKDYEK